MENRRRKGTWYEQMAAKYLQDNGFKIVQKNYRCYAGEIDLIARDGSYLVFVEVKYRKNDRQGMPQEAVNHFKQHTIVKVAQHYMMMNHLDDQTPVRFDVVAILGDVCSLIQNAFEAV